MATSQGYGMLLERPAVRAPWLRRRRDGNPKVNPMWFDWDGELMRFTQPLKRQKYRKSRRTERGESISDPDKPVPHLEVRGVVEEYRARSDRRGLHACFRRDSYRGDR